MVQNAEPIESGGAETPAEPPEPISSRFLFVDVAAQRAKQLRRGALPRVERPSPTAAGPRKLERIAMEEVRQRVIHYTLPPTPEHASRNENA
jgi:DNA-directed RNA polymerase subunit K/omega